MTSILDAPQWQYDREAIRRRGLREFVKRAWPHIEQSAPLRWSWHLDAMCEWLEAISRGELRDVVFNIPPGGTKSSLVSVLWPAWHWGPNGDPGHRFAAVSYSDHVVTRDAQRMRSLVMSGWFRRCWPDVVIGAPKTRDEEAEPAPEQRRPREAGTDTVNVFRTTRGGMRFSTTVLSHQIMGEHTDTLSADDPIDPLSADATSGKALEEVLQWWTGTATTRFRDHTKSAKVCIMQRLHVNDLAGFMIRNGSNVLCLPMRYEHAHPNVSRPVTLPSGKVLPGDARTVDGELLMPERIPADELAKIERVLGPTRTASQMQQRPTPAEGGIFKKAWLQNRWTVLPPDGTWLQSWDCTFKSTKDSDFVVGQVWYQKAANFYLVWQVRGRMSFSETLDAIRALSIRFPKTFKKLIEDKANGSAVIDTLKRELSGITPVEPEGGKQARASSTEPLFAAGNVILPHATNAEYDDGTRGASWVDTDPEGEPGTCYVGEMVLFPNGANDDQADCTTQALNHMAPRHADRMKRAMDAALGRPR